MADDPEEELFGHSAVCTCPNVVEALVKRFLTEDELQAVYNAVTRSSQEE